MSLFSHRKGIRPLQKAVQREAIDGELRNRLWSALELAVWRRWTGPASYGYQEPDPAAIDLLMDLIWLSLFKKPLDTVPSHHEERYAVVREYFFRAEWWQVYDFIEFVMKQIAEPWQQSLREFVNGFLKDENADYRMVDTEITPITDEHESAAVQSALGAATTSAQQHLRRALQLLSDRKQPDYRNSIKESISAVEAICQALSGKSKATLPDCLKVLKANAPMHPAFEQALLKQYGYTSDEGGIRHALTDESVSPSYADAKFMLVSSSAFVNYVLTKAAELKIKISKG